MSKDLSQSLAHILNQLQEKTDFNAIDKAFQELHYDRRTERSEFWCRNSILDYLELLIDNDHVRSFTTEQDLLDEMYGFLKKSRNISQTITDTGCQSDASHNNKNEKRILGANDRLSWQVTGDHADLTFKYISSESGCVEIGLIDHGPHGTKELQESKLKCPKMMRSFCKQIVD